MTFLRVGEKDVCERERETYINSREREREREKKRECVRWSKLVV